MERSALIALTDIIDCALLTLSADGGDRDGSTAEMVSTASSSSRNLATPSSSASGELHSHMDGRVAGLGSMALTTG